jgi:hypothetical protein
VYGIIYEWLEVVLRCLYFRVGVLVLGLFGLPVSPVPFVVVVVVGWLGVLGLLPVVVVLWGRM